MANVLSSNEFGLLPPQATEIEPLVIGAVMLEQESIDTAMNLLTDEMFYSPKNQIVFRAICRLHGEMKSIDLATVYNQLLKDGVIERIGGISYLSDLVSKVVSSAHLEDHCLIIRERYIRRKLIESCSMKISESHDLSIDIDDTIAKLNSELEVVQDILIGKRNSNHISEATKKSIENMNERISNREKGITPGIPTGFADLDRILNGWQKEKFIVLAARPGEGKTSLAIHFGKKAAERGYNVVSFNLEMGEAELSDKMIIGESEISAEKYNSGNLDSRDINYIQAAIGKIAALPIYIDDTPETTINKIINKARLLKKQGKCDMVIIDYLQLIAASPESKGRSREQEVSFISRSIKVHAKELKIPFITLAQMNRGIESEEGKRPPRLSDLRESGSIEQDADIVMFNYRNPKIIDDATGQPSTSSFELIISKHRGGKKGSVLIKHNESMTRFYDADVIGRYSEMPRNFHEPKSENLPF